MNMEYLNKLAEIAQDKVENAQKMNELFWAEVLALTLNPTLRTKKRAKELKKLAHEYDHVHSQANTAVMFFVNQILYGKYEN